MLTTSYEGFLTLLGDLGTGLYAFALMALPKSVDGSGRFGMCLLRDLMGDWCNV